MRELMSKNNNSADNTKELMERNSMTGRWVRRVSNDETLSINLIPQSFITIINNVVSYTDIGPIIEKISNERKNEQVEILEYIYNKIIDSLDNYRVYDKGIDKVFNHCENHASEFDNKIRAISKEFDYNFKHNNNNDLLLKISSAYLKVLFSYLFSSFILNKSKVKNENVIYSKLTSFKDYIQSVMEKIFIPQDQTGELDFEKSIYAEFIYGKKDIQELNLLSQHDTRFKNSLALIKEHNEGILNNNSIYKNKLAGSYSETKPEIIKFIMSLHTLLCDIDNLIKMREEIKNIEDEDIFKTYELRMKGD